MRSPTNNCKAIPTDSNQAPRCLHHARAPSAFCREHDEERRALEERERTAAREADRLRPIIDDMVSEGTKAYTRSRDVKKDERVVRLYLDSLEVQIGAAATLKTRFSWDGELHPLREGTFSFSPWMVAEDRGREDLPMLEKRKECVTAFLDKLQARVDALELQAVATSPSRNSETARTQEPASVSASNVDKPPAYPILDVPHSPCACTANSSDNRPHPCHDLRGWCTAITLRDGLWCTWSCVSGQRFCRIHCVAHGMAVLPHKVKEGMLEAQRMWVARGEGDQACRITDVKSYVDKLDEMVAIVEEHQRLFSCRCEFVVIVLFLCMLIVTPFCVSSA